MEIPKLFSTRISKLREIMVEEKAELYIADHSELMGWLTGYMVSETMYRALMIPLKGSPWLVLRKLDSEQAYAQSWLKEIIGFNDWENPFEKVAESIHNRGMSSATILVDSASYSFTLEVYKQFSTALPKTTFKFRPGLSDDLRAVKDSMEIATIRRAAQIADKSMEKLCLEIGPGTTSRIAGAIAASSYIRFGADDGQVGRICKGHSAIGFLHAELDDSPLTLGDVLHVELVPKVEKYSARIMRPIAIGKASTKVIEIAKKLFEYQDNQIAAMQTGQTAANVDTILRKQILDSGLRSTYENVSGYMLGIYGRTPRSSDFSHVFLPSSNWTIEAGMVFHMYTSAQGIGVSETVLVTDNGGERLTRTPRHLLVSQG